MLMPAPYLLPRRCRRHYAIITPFYAGAMLRHAYFSRAMPLLCFFIIVLLRH
jgi:hypothetical protein